MELIDLCGLSSELREEWNDGLVTDRLFELRDELKDGPVTDRLSELREEWNDGPVTDRLSELREEWNDGPVTDRLSELGDEFIELLDWFMTLGSTFAEWYSCDILVGLLDIFICTGFSAGDAFLCDDFAEECDSFAVGLDIFSYDVLELDKVGTDLESLDIEEGVSVVFSAIFFSLFK